MKIRNGFVSNSSSSSFVVVFPKKPKNVEKVFEYMFPGKDKDDTLEYYGTSLTYIQIASRVYENILNSKKTNLKELAELFSNNYSRYDMNNRISLTPEYNDLLKKLRDLYSEEERKYKEYLQKIRKYDELNGPKPVAFACKGGTNPQTKKPYTEKEINAYKQFEKDFQKARKTPQFEEIEKWYESTRISYDTISELECKLGLLEANEFLKEHKGKYILKTEYGDSDPIGSLMEHGNIFYNLECVRISHH